MVQYFRRLQFLQKGEIKGLRLRVVLQLGMLQVSGNCFKRLVSDVRPSRHSFIAKGLVLYWVFSYCNLGAVVRCM